ncbi:hypothetical protein PTKIN_Ptkin10aG0126100 [Pterospermum kingtungense]
MILGCSTRTFYSVASPLHAETLAIKVGVEFAVVKNLGNVVVESDSKLAIGELQKGHASLSDLGSLFFDICSLKELLG